MPINPVVWFEIYVQDMQRARKFYEAVLEVKLEAMPAPTPGFDLEMWAFPSDKATAPTTYGACGMLVKMEGFGPASRGTLVYFGFGAADVVGRDAGRVAGRGVWAAPKAAAAQRTARIRVGRPAPRPPAAAAAEAPPT